MFLLFLVTSTPGVIGLPASDQCTESISSFTPSVIPLNATHLQISWEKLLDKCDGLVDKAYVVVSTYSRRSSFHHSFIKGKYFMKTYPCKRHDTIIHFSVTNGKLLKSKPNYYSNSLSSNGLKDMYGGILKKVIDEICLKDNKTVMIPDPPKSIESCISAMRDHKSRYHRQAPNKESCT